MNNISDIEGTVRYPAAITAPLLACALVGASLWLQSDIGLNLADEGYLWYGAMQTARGMVPLLDFQSYDPGRYYWVAAWSYIFGDGILALRLGVGIFQAIGLTLGLLAARRAVRSFGGLALTGLVLLLWMHPRHKLFETSLTMAAVFFAVRLIEKPSAGRHLAAGVFVGVAAFFGRNHGFYSAAAFLILIPYLWYKSGESGLLKRTGTWAAGVLVGSLPVLVLIFARSGFLESYISSAIYVVKVGSSNLTLPAPWPWAIDYSGLGPAEAIGRFSTGLFFLLMPPYYLASLAAALLTRREQVRRRGLFIAATCVGVFYMHYAFSRAEINHLAQSVHPLLLSLIAIPAAFEPPRRKAIAGGGAAVLLLATFFTVVRISPFYLKSAYPNAFVRYDVLGDRLRVSRNTARILDGVKGAVSGRVPDGEALMVAPIWPALYCVLERESPVWQLWYVFNDPVEEQEKVLREMDDRDVRWLLVRNVPIDGMEERRFSNTHRIIWNYLKMEFVMVDVPLPDGFRLLRRRRSGGVRQGRAGAERPGA